MHTTPKAMEIENETLRNIVDSFFNENFKRGITSPALTTVSSDMTKNAQKQKTHKKAHSRDTGRE